MILHTDSTVPIYVQISEWLENEIISGKIKADERIYSQYQLADLFNINPATAAKGLNILAEGKMVYKKRGLGMFVSPDAREKLLEERKNRKLKTLVMELAEEMEQLGLNENQLAEMLRQAIRQIREEKDSEHD